MFICQANLEMSKLQSPALAGADLLQRTPKYASIPLDLGALHLELFTGPSILGDRIKVRYGNAKL
ncbi:MAG: hypothetical protein COW04_07720 [Deltaproteobacteria bacterium CG12_big_fil_rev_8_21_14_0_65_43_10]|nr:MAG: hypothetical protein AUK23_04960 [Deltaproteobacteria bacterium CG2_30_43_15]PIQ45429.1 MAG: hypothetical protein COW04_07720 [Deltaproteobacteria bacterium CG12_big_fil_rev_8_21_14_0_65_43_10]PIU86442.1 MAG: hypothetical protein COS67_02355 [Deltaproteobacteria bacterium CG06_land_8_20_14_3_00_44_19]PIX24129.1 MAG: hypothetical protein COZ68_07295 [Deltaproteobacteria bacterium CG_4_8_14_3_um_filter_43_13]PIZ20402.1 MAG: hypothetical protein COY50_04995 [Deltaproteobacteria bacterium C